MLCLFHIQHKVNAITKTTTFQGLLRNFVNNHIRLIRSRGLDFVKGLHDFWLEALHDVLQLSDVDATRDLRALSDSIQKSCLAPSELRNPEVQFYASSAFGFMAYLSFGELIQKGLVPFKVRPGLAAAGNPAMLPREYCEEIRDRGLSSMSSRGTGMEINQNVKRDEVEVLVRGMMEGDKGKGIECMALEWKKKAEEFK
ncbi:hypothetical protein WN943_021792 [Citrus x changshan-huyou]